LEALVQKSPALVLAGSAQGLASAMLAQQVEDVQPDVLLIELEGQDEESLSRLFALGGEASLMTIVILAHEAQNYWTIEALRAGVRAILPREATAEEVVASVEAAAAGLLVLHPAAAERLLDGAASSTARAPHASGNVETLTPREIEVLGMIAEGLGNKTIAWRLGISEHTVKFHVASIFSKIGASSRTEAVTTGIRQGLIML
jgi:DNA-binding NarL/FixJ family response regulator